MRLTDTAIKALRPAEKPQKATDGGGLYLLVQPAGGKWWRFDYRFDGSHQRHVTERAVVWSSRPSMRVPTTQGGLLASESVFRPFRVPQAPLITTIKVDVTGEILAELRDLQVTPVILDHCDRTHIPRVVVIVQAHLHRGVARHGERHDSISLGPVGNTLVDECEDANST